MPPTLPWRRLIKWITPLQYCTGCPKYFATFLMLELE
jgi:hypothetical protein